MKAIWKSQPDSRDYPAALSYLSLVFTPAAAARLVARLRRAKTVQFAAKDVLRASGLAVLDARNSHVADDLRKLKKAKKLSPVLLVRGDASKGLPLIVADGYHRISAGWHVAEDHLVSCRIVSR